MSIDQESARFSTKSAKETVNLGFSLARSLYPPSSKFLLLSGELGAGKTTLIKGLGIGFGFGPHEIQSPTYAVERDYQGKLLHLDLFRIPPEEAASMLERANEYEGFVAVEWSEKLGGEEASPQEGRIDILIEERREEASPRRGAMEGQRGEASGGDTNRTITLTFLDSPLPDEQEIRKWEEEVLFLPNIKEHELAVADLAVKFGKLLLQRNVVVRLKALEAASRVHDLLRFLDFPPEQLRRHPEEGLRPSRRSRLPKEAVVQAIRNVWKELAKKYPGRHENACAEFLKEKGYPVIAEIVRTHGVRDDPHTTEQKILYYADKRLAGTRLVSIDERFDDYARRYGENPERERWVQQAKAIEKELFPEGTPPL